MTSYLRERVKSVGFALHGLARLVRSEPNARIHLAATVAVLAAGVALDVGRGDWCLLVLAMGAVWTAEAMNTAVERLADALAPGFDPDVGKAKDVAAAGVLLAAVAAVAVGALVLGPPLLARLGG